MPVRRPSLILTLLALPALAACHRDAAPPPLDPQALAAVVAQPGITREPLARAVDALFTDPAAAETRAVVVIHGGRLVAERYAPGFGRQTRFTGWSMAKCVTGVLIGLLAADGRLKLDDPAPVAAWQRPGDPRGEITLRELLQMRSGLRHSEHADPIYAADTVRMLFLDGRNDMAAYAEAQPLSAEPGRTWQYSSATSVILADLAAQALTDSRDPAVRRQATADYLRTRLFEPLGLKSMVPEFDAAGTLIGGSMIDATARDWAGFGEFLRNGGASRGTQVLPRSWLAFMTTPSPGNGAYGAHLWLNRVRPGKGEALFPREPPSDFACVGHLGQYLLVSPTRKLTIVRLGQTADDARDPVRRRLGAIAALFPRG
ncbi:MAG: serine hydrolase [Novosphingobium sp.]|nr:serine hydrolase [Novosphingobium sp.]